MNDASPVVFTLRQSGNLGQELISPCGTILAWTTNAVFGALVCRVLNELIQTDDPMAAIFGEVEWKPEMDQEK